MSGSQRPATWVTSSLAIPATFDSFLRTPQSTNLNCNPVLREPGPSSSSNPGVVFSRDSDLPGDVSFHLRGIMEQGSAMAAARGRLCTLSLAPSTSQRDSAGPHTTTWSTSSRRNHVPLSSAKSPVNRHPDSRNPCRSLVAFAVLVDPSLKAPSTIELERSKAGPIVVNSRDLLELVAMTDCASSKLVSEESKSPVQLGLADTDLRSTLEHRLWVGFGGAAVTGMVAKAMLACQTSGDLLQVAAGAAAAWVLADLGTGFYHWGVDNYGDASTPVFGRQIDAFQGHHQRPWTITRREFANNVHAIAKPAGFSLAPFLLLPGHPLGDSFLGLFLGLVVMSQHFHALAHMKKSQLHPYVVAMQDSGVLLGRKMHGTHHRPPYDVNYCIVSGLWNPVLNQTQIFKRIERFIFATWCVAPRSWSETSEEWLQADSYFEDGTEFDPNSQSGSN